MPFLHSVAPAGKTLFLRDECGRSPEISPCTDGYAHNLYIPYCYSECAGADTTCRDCAPCEPRLVTVTNSNNADFFWAGALYELRASSEMPCPCYVQHPATPGRYRMSMPVYASEQDARDNLPVFTVTREFDVTTPDAVVEVELQP